jgi:vacuolar protein sorting-associated protein 13A/C
MFEKAVSGVLNQVLGTYIKDFNAEQVSVGLWNGTMSMKQLQLKPNVFDEFQLPIALTTGTIGSLDISIPWMTVFSSGVRITVKDVYLLCRFDYSATRV